ncbi:tyrosine-type recombinase/integrase [Levilactobacillus tujiorum]|uniref:tyrosine-type recombinase/integrase n=1 Tax=Levilactobacillus tujiorum TaxID=2912243 RepID=UPI00145705AF|nr:site-specific integrase [Levilactobacillus tujiorum]NLR32794.1 site-specific integrase [Levilactobacillus tujiorum]
MSAYEDSNHPGNFKFKLYVSPKLAADGKRHQLVRQGFKSMADAEAAEAQMKDDIVNRSDSYIKTLPFELEFDKWYKLFHKGAADATLKNYAYTHNRIKAFFGDMRLKDVNSNNAQEFINSLVDEELSQQTISKVLGHCKAFFKRQIINQLITANPFLDLHFKASKVREKSDEYKYFAQYQLDRLMPILMDNDDKMDTAKYACLFDLATGARPEELLAVKWNKIDFSSHTVTFDHAIKVKTREYSDKMKNDNSARTIHIDKHTLRQMKKLRQIQQDNDYYDLDGFVFKSYQTKQLMSLDNLNHQLTKFEKSANIPTNYTMYAFRHTHASLILSNSDGVLSESMLLSASKRLGHASPTETMNTYWHLFPSDSDKANKQMDDKIDSLFNF